MTTSRLSLPDSERVEGGTASMSAMLRLLSARSSLRARASGRTSSSDFRCAFAPLSRPSGLARSGKGLTRSWKRALSLGAPEPAGVFGVAALTAAGSNAVPAAIEEVVRNWRRSMDESFRRRTLSRGLQRAMLLVDRHSPFADRDTVPLRRQGH